MGVVYRAFDPDLQQAVAIKVIRKELVEGCGGYLVRLRFKNEAIAGRRLRHPNIVPVYDYGEDHDCSFIVMDWVEGRQLKDVLESGHRFTLSEVLSITEQLLEALDYAHRRNVVHRDIKPSNILYGEAGQIQVVDFGIAKIESSTLTMTGAILGTPGHMAPEQCQGTPSDHRADIFAAGVILYELLTGERSAEGVLVLTGTLGKPGIEGMLAAWRPEDGMISGRSLALGARTPWKRKPGPILLRTDMVADLRHVFGRRIRTLRDSAGISQEERAERSKLHVTLICLASNGGTATQKNFPSEDQPPDRSHRFASGARREAVPRWFQDRRFRHQMSRRSPIWNTPDLSRTATAVSRSPLPGSVRIRPLRVCTFACLRAPATAL